MERKNLCSLYMMQLSKSNKKILHDDDTLIGLGHFDTVVMKKMSSNVLQHNKKIEDINSPQTFYLYSSQPEGNDEIHFLMPFVVFVFTYHKTKTSFTIKNKDVVKFYTTNNADEVFLYQGCSIKECIDVAADIKAQTDFTHSILCYNPCFKAYISKQEIISKMYIRIMIDDYDDLKKFKKKTKCKLIGHKLGNYDCLLFYEKISTSKAMELFDDESDSYIYHKNWENMTNAATCTEFFFYADDFFNKEHKKISAGIGNLVKAGRNFRNVFSNLESENTRLLDPILDVFQNDLEGIYSDYVILNFWKPLKLLGKKLRYSRSYIKESDSIYKLSNVMNDIMTDIFHSTLHTFQLPIPAEPLCSTHIFLNLVYVSFLDTVIKSSEILCDKYEIFGEKFDMSFLFHVISSDNITSEICFDGFEHPPASRMIILNVPRDMIIRPSSVLSAAVHELAGIIEYNARNRKKRIYYIKNMLIDQFINDVKFSLVQEIKAVEKDDAKALNIVTDMKIEAIIKKEIVNEIEKKFVISDYYFKNARNELLHQLKATIQIKAKKIIMQIAAKKIKYANIVIDTLDKQIYDFLYGEKNSLETSLDEIYWVCKECFSDIVMISTLKLSKQEYDEYMADKVNRQNIVRSKIISLLYYETTEPCDGNFDIDDQDKTDPKQLSIVNRALSFPNIRSYIYQYVRECKNSFETELLKDNMKVLLNQIRDEYRLICKLEDENENKVDVFQALKRNMEVYRKNIYHDFLNFKP